MTECRFRSPNDCPEWRKLGEIGRAMERKGITLPSVRRDSPEWQAWRSWLRGVGFPTSWSDQQPPERMMTVTFEWPPVSTEDLDEKHSHWCGGKGKKLDLKE